MVAEQRLIEPRRTTIQYHMQKHGDDGTAGGAPWARGQPGVVLSCGRAAIMGQLAVHLGHAVSQGSSLAVLKQEEQVMYQ